MIRSVRDIATQRFARWALTGALLSLSACANPDDLGVTSEEQVCATGSTLEGIDVSEYQGSIDWNAVHGAGIVFAYARVNDGSHHDPTFARNWSGMRAAGVLRGAYQFFEPGEDPVAQADTLLAAMGTLEADDLPPMLDVEVTGGQPPSVIASRIGTWLAHVHAATGRTPVIYTGRYFWNDSVGSNAFASNPLWIAAYGPACPTLPNGWSNWAMFQYGDNGRIPGIAAAVDVDRFNGTRAQLLALAGGTAAPAPDAPASAPRGIGMAAHPHGAGYWVVDPDGGVFSFGGAPFFGSMGGRQLNAPVVGIAAAPDGEGYWLVAQDGGVFGFGSAGFHGSMGGEHLNAPIVGIAAAADGDGYWLVGSDGGVFGFGSARFFGSMGGQHLNEPVVSMAATHDGGGYWLVARDGGLFAFGNAPFLGSLGATHLNAPIVGMAVSPDGGYWMVGGDGGVFAFGHAGFYGSLGAAHLNAPIRAIAATNDGHGYWMVAGDGGLFAFGDAPFAGANH